MTGAILLALLPIGLLIGLGAVLRRIGFIGEAFWPQAERLGYYVLLPALFVHGLATARLDGVPVLSLAAVLVASTITVALILLWLRPHLALDGAAFTSVFQGGIRFNNYVGVSAAVGLFGAQGLALAAVANAAIVPTVNILCVLVFARFGSGGRLAPAAVAKQLALNPLVVASLLGIALQALHLPLPVGVDGMLKGLGQASLPLGLLCVGAALQPKELRAELPVLLGSCATRLLAMPALAFACAHLLGLAPLESAVFVLFFALPTAPTAYVLTRQLGGDSHLMAGIITLQTLLAGGSLLLVMGVVQALAG